LDYVRIVWPDGVFQTEYDLQRGSLHRIAETQRQVASCPVVFAWDGQAYRFVTDVLGGGGLGFNLGFGEYGEPRPWENLLLPAFVLEPQGDHLVIKIGEPMEETCYLDAARLVAYDLPPGWQMTLDERFATAQPLPTGQPIFFRELLSPIEAQNHRQESVLKELQAVDNVAVEPGERDRRFLGRTAPHWIELTFATPIDRGSPYLLFDGWVEYPYSQTMFAAWQAGASFEPPTIEACDASGQWHAVAVQFGYMAGMPRQSAMPLSVEQLPAGTRRLRLSTNHEIYWDRVAIVFAEEAPGEFRRHELPLTRAEVADVGFAQRTTLAQRRPHYDYSKRDPLWDTRHQNGMYSEFGDAMELLADVDDAVVIIGPGEEVHLEFAVVAGEPEPFQRRYVLELNGWCKDMDLYTRDGETVEPLPRRDASVGLEQLQRREILHRQNHTRLRMGP
jgi:hypothetical protein